MCEPAGHSWRQLPPAKAGSQAPLSRTGEIALSRTARVPRSSFFVALRGNPHVVQPFAASVPTAVGRAPNARRPVPGPAARCPPPRPTCSPRWRPCLLHGAPPSVARFFSVSPKVDGESPFGKIVVCSWTLKYWTEADWSVVFGWRILAGNIRTLFQLGAILYAVTR
jgi:hypothetical protein